MKSLMICIPRQIFFGW